MDKKANSLNESKGATSRSVPKRPTDSYHGSARSAPSSGGGPLASDRASHGKRDKKEKLSQSLKDHPLLAAPEGASGGVGAPNTKDSPDSGSLYSNDEIPSGYNSGEQYDTLSTGYMSGEAYELPDTRPEPQEPTLASIEEVSTRSNEELFTIQIPQAATFPP